MSDNVSTEARWPTWKIALAVGIPVAIAGVGLYYFLSSKSTKSIDKKSDCENPALSRAEPEGSSSPAKTINNEKLNKPKPKIDNEPVQIPLTKLQEAQNYKNEGNQLFKEGQYNAAIKKYSQAIAVCPDKNKTEKSTYHQNKAAAMEKLENWEGVIQECNEAIKLNEKYVKALHRRAKAYEKVDQKENSLEDITTVCILEGFQNASTMMYADTILKQLGKEKAAEKYKIRKPLIPSNLFVKQYFASFTDDPTLTPLTDKMKSLSANSGYIRARILCEDQKYYNIINECTAEIEACKERGDDASAEKNEDDRSYKMEAYLLRGTFHMLAGSSKEARKDFDEVINNENAAAKLRSNALIKRGSMSMQHQNPDKAQEDFTLAVSIDPNNCDVYHHRGQLNILLDKGNDALCDFEKCVELKPDFAMAHAQRCYTKYRQAVNDKNLKAVDHAMKEFEEIIKTYPKCSETYGLYAQAQTDKDNFQKADELFQDAIKIEPNNATLYVHRGLLALQWKQDLNQAVEFISKALKIDEKCDFAHETMGTIEVQRGNLAKAVEHFDISIQYAKTELELAHLFALRAAAVTQSNIAAKYGLRPPPLPTAMM